MTEPIIHQVSTCFQENVIKWSRQTAVDTWLCVGGLWAEVFAEQERAAQDGWLQLLGGQEGGQAGIVTGSLNYPKYSWFFLSSEIPLLSLRSGDRAWDSAAGRAKGRRAVGIGRGRPSTRGLEKEARRAITINLLTSDWLSDSVVLLNCLRGGTVQEPTTNNLYPSTLLISKSKPTLKEKNKSFSLIWPVDAGLDLAFYCQENRINRSHNLFMA